MCSVRFLVLVLASVLVTSVFLIDVSAQTASKPSAPEFTVSLLSSPDPQAQNNTIELSIKNNNASFYNVRVRVNGGNWSVLYPDSEVPIEANGEYTLLSYYSGFLDVEYQYGMGYTTQNLFPGDRIDFQVQAMVGTIHRGFNPNATGQLDMYPYVFTGEKSDWSNTQTITMPAASDSEFHSPGTTDFSTITLVLLLIAVILLIVVFAWQKRKR